MGKGGKQSQILCLWDLDPGHKKTSSLCQFWAKRAQLQNPGPHQRPLDVAATGCAKYVHDNVHVNETIRKITIHK